MAQLVRVEVLYPIPFAKSLEVTSWSVWVHRLRAVVLRKHPAHRYQLTLPQLLQKRGHVRRDVYNAGLAVFGQSLVHAPLGGVLQIPLDGDRVGIKIHRLPLQPAGLAPAAARIDKQQDKRPPLERLTIQTAQNIPRLLRGKSLVLCRKARILRLPGARNLVHWIPVYRIIQQGSLKQVM